MLNTKLASAIRCKVAKFLISSGAPNAEDYLAGLRKALAAGKPVAPALPLRHLKKIRAVAKRRGNPDPAALLEKLTGRARSGSGYVLGD